tara:strand:- start:5742 stop:6143 length:402 start_codon:yes stop_codon:yes gene_type:complete
MDNIINLDRSQRLDIICRKGDTFTLNLELKDDQGVPIDLTGNPFDIYSFLMEVRLSDTSSTVVLTPTPNIAKKIDGLVTFSVPASGMVVNAGLYVYDIQQTRTDTVSGNPSPQELSVETLLFGTFKINEDVTV